MDSMVEVSAPRVVRFCAAARAYASAARSLHERFDQPGGSTLPFGPRAFVALRVHLIAPGDVVIAESAPDALRHLLVLHHMDAVRLVVADPLLGDLRRVAAAQRGERP